MASASSTGEPTCQTCHQQHKSKLAKFICQDCVSSRRYMCSRCKAGHATYDLTANHRVIDLKEYRRNRTKYLMAKQDTCEIHQGSDNKIIRGCRVCQALMCLMCIEDRSLVCPKANTGGERIHDPEALATGVTTVIRNIQDAGETATELANVAMTLVADAGELKAAVATSLSDVLESLEKERRRLHRKVNMRINTLKKIAMDRLNECIMQLTSIEDDLQAFLQNNANDQLMAEQTLASPLPIEVYRMADDLIEQLLKMPNTALPALSTVALIQSEEAALEALMTSIQLNITNVTEELEQTSLTTSDDHVPFESGSAAEGGLNSDSLNSSEGTSDALTLSGASGSAEGYRECLLGLPYKDRFPMECQQRSAGRPLVTIEVAQHHGLFTVSEAGERRMMDKAKLKAVLPYYFNGVSMNEDETVCFCTGGRVLNWNVKQYAFDAVGSVAQTKEERVQGAKCLQGIAFCPATNQLAVVDRDYPRITIHTAADLKRTGTAVERTIDGQQILGRPRYVAWNERGTALYFTDSGWGNMSGVVSCVSVTESPKLVWRALLDNPWNISCGRASVYVTHKDVGQVSVLTAARGVTINVLQCRGRPRGVTEDEEGVPVITSYKV